MTPRLASLLLGLATTAAFGQIAGLKPGPGAVADGRIAIPAGVDPATEIPITVMRGAKPGPTLAIIAGTAGTAYGPIGATYQLSKLVDLSKVSGTIIVVHIANLPAFVGRTVYGNPIDHKDLDRSFPGKADGTSSERIAHALTTQVISQADYLVSLQAGGTNTLLLPHVFEAVSGDDKLDSKMAAMARAFGITHIVMDKNVKRPSGTVENAAVSTGKPVLKVMCGSFGIADNRTLDAITKGIISLMDLLEMTPGKPANTRTPVYIDQTATMDSPQSGILSVYVQRGQNVRKGESVYSIGGFQNKNVQEMHSPIDGIVLYVISTPPVNKGETVVLLGAPRQ